MTDLFEQSDLNEVLKLLAVNSAGALFPVHMRGDENGAIVNIRQDHFANHIGKLFTHSGIHQGIAVNSYVDHIYIVASGMNPHTRLGTVEASGAPFWIEFFEGVQVTSLGTLAEVKNLNRNFPDSDSISVYEGPDVTSTGERLFAGLISGTTQTGGDHDFSNKEWILRGGTSYLLRMWNKSNQAQDASLTQVWYSL